MKKFVAILSFLLSLFFVVPAQKVNVYERPLQYERSRDYDAKHYRIALTFDLDKKYFEGENRITLTPLRDDFKECLLDAEELVVTAVTNSENMPLQFTQTDKLIIVHLSKAYEYGETVTFTVKYHATDPKVGLFFDEESPTNPIMVSTVSWPDRARHWFPSYDFPHDKVTNEMIITVKNKYKVLSNGKLVSVKEDKKNGTKTYHWSQELPHSTYLFMLAIGPFAVIEDSLGSLPVTYWVYEKDVEDAKWIFKKTPHMIDYFNRLFGYEYPWAQYAQVTSPRMGGGAENTAATVLGQGVIHDKRAEQDFSWERIIAHEVAHQWWGDLITLRTWSQTWLNESFGTYSDYLYTRHDKGEDEGAYDLLRKKNRYLQEAHTRYIRPVVFDRYNRPEDNFDSHTYPKGAAVLHMLRFVMGDKPFFRTLKHFLHKHEFQAVDTHDFMTAIKDVTGQNLDWFFEQFIFKPGHPFFKISYTWDEQSQKIKLKVVQTQDTSQGIPIYTIPVIIGITTPEKKISEKVWIKHKEQAFEFSVDKKPLLVRFDEGNYLLKEWTFEKNMEELLYQLKNDDVIGRSWAASELAEFQDDPMAMRGLKDRAQNDEFWAVRRSAIETLGTLKKKEHLSLFKETCEDKNSKVRVAALGILGNYEEPELVSLFKKQFIEDDSYLAQAEALRAIGKCGDRSHLSFLKEAAKMESPRNVIKIAADWAIKEINKT
ncbi:MAG TPA: aminopeptidase [Candidatus Aminicenantes bacterium]|nr:aminopeptidase [Candidatus Aminicenantes bacterium]